MRIVIIASMALVVVLGFQNCSQDMGSKQESTNSQAAAPNPNPAPGPAPSPGGSQVQPNATNSIADVKPLVAGNCPSSDYGVYDMVNTTPAISTVGWPHQICLKPFMAGTTSVISEATFVAGSSCAAGSELLMTIPVPANYTNPRWNLVNSICIKRSTVPVTASFVTYFYFSAPGQMCRTGDLATGSATFCTVGNAANACQGGLAVNLCKSIQ